MTIHQINYDSHLVIVLLKIGARTSYYKSPTLYSGLQRYFLSCCVDVSCTSVELHSDITKPSGTPSVSFV